MTIDFSLMITYQNLHDIVQKRIDLIDPISGQFKITLSESRDLRGAIEVSYNEIRYAHICYYVNTSPAHSGMRHLCTGFTVRLHNDSYWHGDKLEQPFVNVGNDGMCWCKGNEDKIPLDQLLDIILPIADINKVEKVEDAFKNNQILIASCKFNTYEKRYEIDMDLSAYLDEHIKEKETPNYLHKYVSFDTFMAMLQNKTFRMNSVVAMNDTSETFALGDVLNEALGDADRYRSLIASKNALITSFCGDGDYALMWRLYGENGKGVCLCFTAPKDTVKPIVYVKKDGRDSKLSKLKEIISQLNKDGIAVHIKQMDELKYFVKSCQFDYENEYRLLRYEPDENLKIVNYGDLMSYCHDYEIESNGNIKDLDLKLHEVTLGTNLPNPDINYPLIVDALKRELGVGIVNWSKVDALR